MDGDACREIQMSELELLKAAYLDEVTVRSGLTAEAAVSKSFLSEATGCDKSNHISMLMQYTAVRAKLAEGLFLDISLPSTYPNTPLTASLYCLDPSIKNRQIEQVNALILGHIQHEFDNSSLNCMDVISFSKGLVDTLSYSSDTNNKNLRDEDSPESCYSKLVSESGRLKLARILIWFHHIKSPTKKKEIVNQAADLGLGGIWKEGFPGVVIAEGVMEDVYEYVRRLQQLRWQHMVVRGEEVEDLEVDPTASTSEVRGRKFERGLMVEVDSMSDLGQICKERGIHELFMSITKKNAS
jgi:hypothetical protein